MCSVQCLSSVTVCLLLIGTPPSTTLHTIFSDRALDTSAPVSLTVTRVPVLIGGEADLPCPVIPTEKNDSLLLIVWYIGLDPVYSYDSRLPESSAHWVEEPYEGRARWHNGPTAGLRLTNVQANDRATYRCRVDFYKSQTTNYRIALDVVELPNKPIIFDHHGREVLDTAGPYHEGDDIRLICTVRGGHPSPKLQWIQDGIVLKILKPSYVEEPARSLTLVIANATRKHFNAMYTCTAENTMLAPQLKTNVKIDMYLKPLTVEIISRDLPLSVDRKSELWCKTSGARPPATLTWFLGGLKMDAIKTELVAELNMTESLLEWIPKKEQHGQILSCKANHLNRTTIESKLPLNVYYMPETSINLGDEVNPNDIEEGDDVDIVCNVDANPPAYKVVWEHDGMQLQHNPSNNVIITQSRNLRLRNVSRYQAGHYTCTASNVEGDGKSPPLHLQVIYRPVCQTNQIMIKGAALQEATTVDCSVHAFPPPETFEWMLNSSAGLINVNPDRFTIDAKEGISVLTYTPVSDADFGTLSCRATNLAGQQASPCEYTLVPVTRPDAPTNCTVYNLTDDSLDLLCIPGYDGGRQSVYVAEVWSRKGLIVNESNSGALWNLRRLGRNRQLKIIVYAANDRGRSEHNSFIIDIALKLSSKKEKDVMLWDVNWAVGILLAAALTLGLILCLAFVVMKLRHTSSDYEVALASLKNHNVVVQNKDSPLSADDRNPDLIPLNKEVSEVLVAPAPPPYAAHAAALNSSARVPARELSARCLPPFNTQNETLRGWNGTTRPPREIVTTKTPLLGAQRESCV